MNTSLNYNWQHGSTLVVALVFITSAKILCIPAYRSTDFDVHRNWLSITRHLPLSEWYFDDINGTTVHTLDYPPAFAFYEFILSNSPVTEWLIRSNRLDERCLEPLPDFDNEPSKACVIFHRSTVILSDAILWIGAYLACDYQGFLLTVLHPGLLWLDHVHFQYNGALLGILLASLGLLVKGDQQTGWKYHAHYLGSAALYALLITLKHLYITLAPFYFVYLLSNYCFRRDGNFSAINFLAVATVAGGTLVIPFVPFLLQENPMQQMAQIVARLFPFGRGLVHDYWAANVWALWMLLDKVMKKLLGVALPEVSPVACSLCLVVALLPGLVWCWRASSKTFLYCIIYGALASFMLAYHVHEKAIMTAIIPLTMLVRESTETKLLYLRINALGLIGLFPVLFRPIELPLKVFSFVSYMTWAYHLLGEAKLAWFDWFGMTILAVVVAFLEVLHPLFVYPSMEFLPLLLISITCSVGLIGCCVHATKLTFQSLQNVKTKSS
jgi:alpha-1,3-glucosyltransferase